MELTCLNKSKTETTLVLVLNGRKRFAGKENEVISGLNMSIPRGAIYSLLGCSGCGKSTTLSCILGLDKFTSGTVLLFGKKPGPVVNPLGRNLVGYMPQDYALHEELTILESFIYFGGLNGIAGENEIFKNLLFYTNLLNLPPNQNQLIRQLSGGQKRRVSLAISLQHEPQLLVLDEPTVGVDPLLRRRVWQHLSYLTTSKGVTVLITTHYVEEAKHSDVIAIMDNGKLIAEESPSVLLQRFATTSLEKVVHSLTKTARNNPIEPEQDISNNFPMEATLPKDNLKHSQFTPSLARIKTLAIKNWRVAMRNKMMFAIAIIIPATTLLSFYIGYGLNLHNLNPGVVNDDFEGTCDKILQGNLTECQLDQLSCRLIYELRSRSAFNLKEYKSEEEAEEEVKLGNIWGFLHIPPDYSWNLYERAVSRPNETLNIEELITNSMLTLRLDKTNTPAVELIHLELFKAMKEFLLNLLSACGYIKDNLSFGFVFEEPIVGEKVDSLNAYVVPSLFIYFVLLQSNNALCN